MPNIRRIIVPIDFQKHTDDIAAFAINIAKNLDAKPTFVHVVEHFAEAAGYADVYPASFIEIDQALYGYAQKKMGELLAQNKSACPGCAGAVLRGDAVARPVPWTQVKNHAAALKNWLSNSCRACPGLLNPSFSTNQCRLYVSTKTPTASLSSSIFR